MLARSRLPRLFSSNIRLFSTTVMSLKAGIGAIDHKDTWSVSKVLNPLPTPPSSSSSSPIAFLHVIERLKTNAREGWKRHGIVGESIADHMYRMSVITMLCPDPTIQKDKCIKMAIVHDMAECLVGDITPLDGVEKSEKHRRELESMEYLTQTLLAPISKSIAREFMDIWEEYEQGQSPEAIFVKDVDRYELILQTIEYERAHNLELEEFFHVAERVQTPFMKDWVAEALEMRAHELKLTVGGAAN
ncbi:hypothetical protein TWF225_002588 [Orbilia oligospora]|uniref:5'-deoxynucleotidase n=1 Tax=Orbilia oligospora TaxID=2813651 RepID=A0A7C8JZ32_ORBOL|nr:hypothetical protein TWF751_002173 [Orbilia oligospora]KAF3190097.1 hypothetical protein TWF225_002588 [Orbilia oligospora]KAF3244836.1 hypothetical protein TWF217_010667 [Orbilia oligospora]KAF3246961.1 hypothetical protein TWF128_008736 [Orbilia oligospora]KAF3281395.1 hypothetical protein TWF132_011273 [Orbilia oligospora]